MKKGGIGCLLALGVLVGVIAVGSYILMQRAKDFVGGVAQFAEISRLNEQVRDQRSYDPPLDQPLGADQVSRYVDVQRAMLARLGTRVKELEAKYEQLSEKHAAANRDANVREIMGAWRDMVGLIVEGKQAQVDAINAAGMSLAEYNWVRAQILLTLGHGFAAVDFAQLAEGASVPAPPDAPPADVREQNLEILQPHLEDAEDWLPLSFFGL